jgi:hypothetical protein
MKAKNGDDVSDWDFFVLVLIFILSFIPCCLTWIVGVVCHDLTMSWKKGWRAGAAIESGPVEEHKPR